MFVHLMLTLLLLQIHLTICTHPAVKKSHLPRQVEYCYVPCGQGWCCSIYEYCTPSPEPNNGFGPYQCVEELYVYAGGSSAINFADNPSMDASDFYQENPGTTVTTYPYSSYPPLETPYTPFTITASAPVISQSSSSNSRSSTSASSTATSTSSSAIAGQTTTSLATATTSTFVPVKSTSSGSGNIMTGKLIVRTLCFWVAFGIMRAGAL